MGWYYDGSITVKGEEATLSTISNLLENLSECSAVSGFSGDTDWLQHIFDKQYTKDGIFYEGHAYVNGRLEVYIRASRTDGEDFFREMAEQLGVCITWDCVSEEDNKHHVNTYNRDCSKRIGEWQLRQLSSAPTEEPPKDRPHYNASWQDIEMQLLLATNISTTLRNEADCGCEFVNCMKATAAAHAYIAACMLYDTVLERDPDKAKGTAWDAFVRYLRAVEPVFSDDYMAIPAFIPNTDNRIDYRVQSDIGMLFKFALVVYQNWNPMRGFYVSMLSLYMF